MDKKRTKAYRIAKGESRLKRKIRLAYHSGWYYWDNGDYGTRTMLADLEKDVLSGNKYTWMRSVNTPCSCYLCSGYHKYKRDVNITTRSILNDDEI